MNKTIISIEVQDDGDKAATIIIKGERNNHNFVSDGWDTYNLILLLIIIYIFYIARIWKHLIFSKANSYIITIFHALTILLLNRKRKSEHFSKDNDVFLPQPFNPQKP